MKTFPLQQAALTTARMMVLGLLWFGLGGCGKAGTTTSSAVQASSSSAALTGNAAQGKILFDGGLCSGCHGLKSSGPFSTGRDLIDMANLQHTQAQFAELKNYIQTQMPNNSASGCVDQCAADTAAYLLTWLAPGSSSSRQTSSQQQSSSVANLSGPQLYEAQCFSCHGEQGNGSTRIIANNWTLTPLSEKIRTSMPQGNPASCDQDCADAIAHYILSWQTSLSCDTPEVLLPRRLRLLTPREYQLTINTAFNLSAWDDSARNLPITETVRGYDNNAPNIHVSNAHISQYWSAAEVLAAKVNVNSLLSCSGLDEATCAQQWVSTIGSKLFRRPLSAAETQEYVSVFLREQNTTSAKRLTLKAFLMSPNFIYRSEIGEVNQQGEVVLTPYEVASLLSYTYWGTMPDSVLLTAAANNQLSTPDQIRQQVLRLLADNRARQQLVYFAKQWLETTNVRYIAKDTNQFFTFNGDVSAAMDDEVTAFISDAFLISDRKFADLYTADYVFVTTLLAEFYGISGVDSTSLVKTAANTERGGILNLGAVLAAHAKMDQTSPIARGVFVRERLLCQEFPAPPPNAGTVVPLNPALSTRERFSAHTDNDGCRTCHEKIDPIGFSFERYDATGKFRLTEGNNISVDDSGSLTGLQRMSDGDYWPYSGTQGLAQILAQSDHAAACLADQYQTYVQGVAKVDSCGVSQLVERWSATDYSLKDLLVESALAPSFIRRQGGSQP